MHILRFPPAAPQTNPPDPITLAPALRGEYLALSLDGLIDCDAVGALGELVSRLAQQATPDDGDLAIWFLEDAQPPRLICVLRAAPDGRVHVRYL